MTNDTSHNYRPFIVGKHKPAFSFDPIPIKTASPETPTPTATKTEKTTSTTTSPNTKPNGETGAENEPKHQNNCTPRSAGGRVAPTPRPPLPAFPVAAPGPAGGRPSIRPRPRVLKPPGEARGYNRPLPTAHCRLFPAPPPPLQPPVRRGVAPLDGHAPPHASTPGRSPGLKLPTAHRPLPTPSRGLTLIELLITIVIMIAVLGGVIPMLSPNNEARQIREGARQLNTMIAQAQARAARDGRPVGIAFRETNVGGQPSGVAMEAFFIAEPQIFAGFSPNSQVRVRIHDSDEALQARTAWPSPCPP